ncbi:MAG: ATP-binding cassette domain-containing protein [Nitratireductor sp.]
MSTQKQTSNSAACLHLNNVCIGLNGETLLEVNEKINPGEVLTIMGPSGSGKSTLLAFIAGFLDTIFKVEGSVHLHDQIITQLEPQTRNIGLLFQDPMLFPHMSVGQNLNFAIKPEAGATKLERKALVEEALNVAGLENYYDRDPATLSGGQKSRVALMRVLLSNPNALLLDEPFSKLDASLRTQIRKFVFSEAKLRKLPILMVTHDEEDAKAAQGKVIVL